MMNLLLDIYLMNANLLKNYPMHGSRKDSRKLRNPRSKIILMNIYGYLLLQNIPKCREEEKQGLPRKGFMGHIYKILQLIVDYHKLDLDESEDSRPSNEMIRHKVRFFY